MAATGIIKTAAGAATRLKPSVGTSLALQTKPSANGLLPATKIAVSSVSDSLKTMARMAQEVVAGRKLPGATPFVQENTVLGAKLVKPATVKGWIRDGKTERLSVPGGPILNASKPARLADWSKEQTFDKSLDPKNFGTLQEHARALGTDRDKLATLFVDKNVTSTFVDSSGTPLFEVGAMVNAGILPDQAAARVGAQTIVDSAVKSTKARNGALIASALVAPTALGFSASAIADATTSTPGHGRIAANATAGVTAAVGGVLLKVGPGVTKGLGGALIAGSAAPVALGVIGQRMVNDSTAQEPAA